MINLTKNQIDIGLTRIERGLNQYYWIQRKLSDTNVSIDNKFQGKFIYFYKIRRNREWLGYYFSLLEYAKYNNIDFKNAFNYMLKKTGRYEASFASKLIATVQPELPVIDQFVLKNVGLRLPYIGAKNRISKIIRIYEELIEMFGEFLTTEMGMYLVKKFNESFSGKIITSTKMVDLVLWQSR